MPKLIVIGQLLLKLLYKMQSHVFLGHSVGTKGKHRKIGQSVSPAKLYSGVARNFSQGVRNSVISNLQPTSFTISGLIAINVQCLLVFAQTVHLHRLHKLNCSYDPSMDGTGEIRTQIFLKWFNTQHMQQAYFGTIIVMIFRGHLRSSKTARFYSQVKAPPKRMFSETPYEQAQSKSQVSDRL